MKNFVARRVRCTLCFSAAAPFPPQPDPSRFFTLSAALPPLAPEAQQNRLLHRRGSPSESGR